MTNREWMDATKYDITHMGQVERDRIAKDDGDRTRIGNTPDVGTDDDVSSYGTVTIQAGRNSNRVFNAIVRFEEFGRCELERTYTHSGEMGFDIFEWVSAGKLPK